MLNSIKITSTTQLATGQRINTCEMFLTLPAQAVFQREVFPQFNVEILLGVQRPIGPQMYYYCFDLDDSQEQLLHQLIDQASLCLQQPTNTPYPPARVSKEVL